MNFYFIISFHCLPAPSERPDKASTRKRETSNQSRKTNGGITKGCTKGTTNTRVSGIDTDL